MRSKPFRGPPQRAPMGSFRDYLHQPAARSALRSLAGVRAIHAELYFERSNSWSLGNGRPPRFSCRLGAAWRRLDPDGLATGAWTDRPTPSWLESDAGRPSRGPAGVTVNPCGLVLPEQTRRALDTLEQRGQPFELSITRQQVVVLTLETVGERVSSHWSLRLGHSKGNARLTGLGLAPPDNTLRMEQPKT